MLLLKPLTLSDILLLVQKVFATLGLVSSILLILSSTYKEKVRLQDCGWILAGLSLMAWGAYLLYEALS